ncbi:MAG: hypothetical protein IPN61_12875 [Bacteroidetes bacterium]|nr:hypothetical protein [Bacteroidota bacterium]
MYDAQVSNESFVSSNTGDIDMIYHSLAFESDSTSPMKNPKKFAVVDTAITGKKTKKKEIDKTYINAVPRDPQLLPDFAKNTMPTISSCLTNSTLKLTLMIVSTWL